MLCCGKRFDESKKSNKKDCTVTKFEMRLVPYLKQQYNYSHPRAYTRVNCTQLFIVIILSMPFCKHAYILNVQ